MKKLLVLYVLVLWPVSGVVCAQILTVTPEYPTADSSIVLIYDATKGNGELAGYTGDVYMHTGVITAESTGPGDWKYVVSDWGENIPKTKLTSLGNDLYRAEYHIRSFYGIPDDETVVQLAFVFRSEDAGLAGRDADGGDIFYPLAFGMGEAHYQSHTLSNDTLIVSTDGGDILITPCNPNILNIFSGVPGKGNYPSYSVIAVKEAVPVQFSDEENYLKFATDSMELVVDKTDLSFHFVVDQDTILEFLKIYNFEDRGTLVSALKADERIYGTGSRAIEMDRKGRSLEINNQAIYGYGLGAENLNITLPVLNSSEKYLIFYDNHSLATLDVGSVNPGRLSYSFTGQQADVFVIAGDSHGELIRNYTFLTGLPALPPVWSLGYIQSKYGYETQEEASNIVNQIIQAGFPLDALIIDLYWFGDPGTMGNLDWDFSRFPDPYSMMEDFADRGVKIILITETYFTLASTNYEFLDSHGYLAKDPEGNTYVLEGFWAGDAALLDLFHPEVPSWFKQFYTDRTNEGAAGWWTDLGEPETHPADMVHYGGLTAAEIHNVYALEWERIVYENWQEQFPDRRLFNLSRSGFAGMQRYSAFPWSGDIQRTFGGLEAQIPIMLSMGLNGIPYMHSDVGGLAGLTREEELFIRWVQMGVFAPVFRIHGFGIETSPTSYSENAQRITRKYIQLRYQLLPYNYTLAYEAALNGTPLARPMDFYDARNAGLQNINDQYFWGGNFIIAPVLREGQTRRNVVLPAGNWLNYHDLTAYQGPGTITLPAPLDDIPVLVKAGSFVPVVRDLQTTDEYSGDTLFIQYFPDPDQAVSGYTLYDDDKTSPRSLTGNQFNLINLKGTFSEELIGIDIGSNGQSYPGMTAFRQLVFEVMRITMPPGSVLLDEEVLDEYTSLDELLQQSAGYCYDSESNKLYVSFPYLNGSNHIRIEGVQVTDIQAAEASDGPYRIYPNPGSEFLWIDGPFTGNDPVQVRILDQNGRTVLETAVMPDLERRIETGEIPAGLYFVHVLTAGRSQVLKWVRYRTNH